MIMSTMNSTKLASFVNNYTIAKGPPKTIVIHEISKINLAALQDITVTGTLLDKQFIRLDPQTNQRHVETPHSGGQYSAEAGDGDLHFCLGDKPIEPHIACELQNAKAWISTFNKSIGKPIAVSGFFRCMFEHPGFASNDDAHIFEIHPVRAVSIDGSIHAFNIDTPEQKSIHSWTKPHNLNQQDRQIKVKYDKAKDTLTFTGMVGKDENYVQVKGNISKVKLNTSGGAPASFTLDSRDIGHPIQVYCLQGTTAARQLRQLKNKKKNISMIALRNIDLGQALKNRRYVINLLAIYIQ